MRRGTAIFRGSNPIHSRRPRVGLYSAVMKYKLAAMAVVIAAAGGVVAGASWWWRSKNRIDALDVAQVERGRALYGVHCD